MVRGQKKQKEYLSPSELINLNDEKAELRSTLKELEEGAGSGNRGSEVQAGQLNREIARIDNAINERTPVKARGIEKDALLKEEKELEEAIAAGMPTRFEMRRPTENPGAVRKHMEWGKRNQSRIERYVKIQRILRPMEPKSIEVLRKDK